MNVQLNIEYSLILGWEIWTVVYELKKKVKKFIFRDELQGPQATKSKKRR